jgi:C1A family cysteine protease
MYHQSTPRGCLSAARIAALQATFLIIMAATVAPVSADVADSEMTLQLAPAIPDLDQDRPAEMGFVPPACDLSHIKAPLATRYLALSARFDWRESGKVTPVRNQGSCGSCYAFAALANVESRLLIDGSGALDLSENNAKECEYFGSSCGGGNDWIVAHYLSTRGTVLEACDPYRAADVACTGGCAYQQTLLEWRVISGSTVPPVDVLKSYIQTYGPVYTTMYAGNGDAWYSEYQRYNGSYTLYYTGTQAPNHAVLIVGWDDTLPHAGGTGAWIVKNSWGTSWGGTCGYGSQRGYFTIAYGSAKIGSYSSFLDRWQAYDPNGTLLYLDEAGFTGSLGYGNRTVYGMCKFVAQRDYMIRRVEFWTLDATSDVDVYIYDAFNGTAVSGLLASKMDNSFPLAGYHSIELTSPVRVNGGNDVYVVVKITDVTSKFPMAYDTVGPKTAGSSYISPTGATYTEFANGDLALRLRCTNALACAEAGEAPSVTSIEDAAGDNGGFVRVAWTKSTYDGAEESPTVRVYRIWRRRLERDLDLMTLGAGGPQPDGPYEVGPNGLAWEVVATVPATGQCCYESVVPTHGDASGADTAWTYFFVSAQTGTPGERFDSPVEAGYSIDDGSTLSPPEGGPEGTGQDDPTPPALTLGQPEPNPARDKITLRFENARPEQVTLAVYDVAGRCIAVLLDGTVDAGSHVASWQPGSGASGPQAPGLYFARLATATEVKTAKVVLAR